MNTSDYNKLPIKNRGRQTANPRRATQPTANQGARRQAAQRTARHGGRLTKPRDTIMTRDKTDGKRAHFIG